MEYRHINGIEKPISRLVQGTVYSTDERPDEAFALFDAVYDLGCNTFDTAHVYNAGKSERILGQWIESRGIREKVVIMTKGAHPMRGEKRVTPHHIQSDIAESLERLKTDKIDVYLLHRDDPEQPVGPIIEALNKHHRAGRIGIFGGSNWSQERLQAANMYAEAHGLKPFMASSPQFSLAEMVVPSWDGCMSIGGDTQRTTRDWYRHNQMPLFVWSSLAGGFMTGKFRRDNLEQWSDYFDTVTIKAYAYEDNFRKLDRAEKLAHQKGVTLPQISLAYVLRQPLNIFALVGALNRDQFADNLAALNVTLTDDERLWLEYGDTIPQA